MTILFANNYYYLRGGSERVLFDDAKGLRDRGITVVPFATAHPENIQDEFTPSFPIAGDYQTAANMTARAKAAAAMIFSSRAGKAFEEVIRRTNPSMVHCHNIYGRLTTSILRVARRHRVPVVMTVHDYKLACPAYLMLRGGKPCSLCTDGNYYRSVLHRCHKNSLAASGVYAAESYFNRWARMYSTVDRFLCPSRFVMGQLQNSGIAPDRTVYHANAVDSGMVKPSSEPGKYALYVGRLSPEKGVSTLLEALPENGLSLQIAGIGPIEAELRAIVERRRLTNVTFHGYCGTERLRELYQGAAFIVVPSEWYENAPMAILEAFAYGKPAIASRIGGIPELVRHAGTGYLFEPGNRAELQSALSLLTERPDAIRSMGQAARTLVESEFSQQIRIDSLMRIYRELSGAPLPQLASETIAHSPAGDGRC
jgi:glycosyltransferase involved in cell wall biosynthesis